MKIKQICSEEFESVIDLFNQYRVFYGQKSDVPLAKKFISERLEHNESIILVAFSEGEQETSPIGFTQLYPKYSSVRAIKNWILNDLYVTPDYQRQGVGRALISKGLEFARDTNAKFVQLETAVDNFKAQRLYDSIGFIRQPADEEYFVYKIFIE